MLVFDWISHFSQPWRYPSQNEIFFTCISLTSGYLTLQTKALLVLVLLVLSEDCLALLTAGTRQPDFAQDK